MTIMFVNPQNSPNLVLILVWPKVSHANTNFTIEPEHHISLGHMSSIPYLTMDKANAQTKKVLMVYYTSRVLNIL